MNVSDTQPLANIGSAIFRTARLIGEVQELADNGAGDPGDMERISQALDLLAFVIAVETVLFVDSEKEDLSDEAKKTAIGLLSAASRLLSSMEKVTGRMHNSGRKSGRLEDALVNTGRIIRSLRVKLTYLCFSWIAGDIISLTLQVRNKTAKN